MWTLAPRALASFALASCLRRACSRHGRAHTVCVRAVAAFCFGGPHQGYEFHPRHARFKRAWHDIGRLSPGQQLLIPARPGAAIRRQACVGGRMDGMTRQNLCCSCVSRACLLLEFARGILVRSCLWKCTLWLHSASQKQARCRAAAAPEDREAADGPCSSMPLLLDAEDHCSVQAQLSDDLRRWDRSTAVRSRLSTLQELPCARTNALVPALRDPSRMPPPVRALRS